MAMDDHITKMSYIIFTISVLAAGLIPVAWNILGGQASLVEATSNSTSQTLTRDLFGTSEGTFSNPSYTAPTMAVVPSHLSNITSVDVSTSSGNYPILTINGVGFGSTAPASGVVDITLQDETTGNLLADNTNGLTIQSWSDTQIVISCSAIYPSDALTLSITGTTNGDTATYTFHDGFATSTSPSWTLANFSSSGWINAYNFGTMGMAPWSMISGWNDPNAQWFWPTSGADSSAAVGTVEFRTTFNAPSAGTYIFEATSDNEFKFYVDGIEVSSGDDYEQTYTVSVNLSGGNHEFAIEAANVGTSSNPAGMIVSVANANDSVMLDQASAWTTPGYVSNQAF